MSPKSGELTFPNKNLKNQPKQQRGGALVPISSAKRKVSYIPREFVRAEMLYPVQRLVRLEYRCGFNQTSVALTSSTTNNFRLNSIFDPDVDNVTRNGTAEYYTQLSAAYSKYLVRFAEVKIQAINIGTLPGRVCLTANCDLGTGYGGATYPSVIAQRDDAVSGIATQYTRPLVLRRRYDLAEVAGFKQDAFDIETYGADMGANPTVGINLHVSSGSLDEYATPGCSSNFDLLIVFYVELARRAYLSGS